MISHYTSGAGESAAFGHFHWRPRASAALAARSATPGAAVCFDIRSCRARYKLVPTRTDLLRTPDTCARTLRVRGPHFQKLL
ncbi:hypothetical protein EVAR_98212_1 [Eumeta japonica]|uniref:Uncharacterized protein n=1 Tax=Eumeta variegata TaxID=151549 RepID=A0A4C1Y729_EUMVA|nr:hypothetical protein EVAR_98212_1 [Eumeta japonica]